MKSSTPRKTTGETPEIPDSAAAAKAEAGSKPAAESPAQITSAKAQPAPVESPSTKSEAIPSPAPKTLVAAAAPQEPAARAAAKLEQPIEAAHARPEPVAEAMPQELAAPAAAKPETPVATAHPQPEPVAEAMPAPVEPPTPPALQVVEPEQPVELTHPQPEPMPEPSQPVYRIPHMFIVHITPELAPVAKVGGLADVVSGLSRELELRGNSVEIVLPKYQSMRYDHIWGLTPTYQDLWVPWYEGAIRCTVFFGFVHGRKCFFIEPHSRDNFFTRGSIYGFNDDVMRFAFFTRAAMEFLWKSGKHPDIIHCHDWQTALAPVFLYEIYQRLGMTHPRVCFTIHNFKHQGTHGAELLRATGLHRPDYFFHYDRMRDNNNPSAINLMKSGIVYSNFVTTVSPHYAGEAKDHGQGFGLERTLQIHHAKFGGVVNGVDYEFWNPELDPYIPVRYGLGNIDAKYDNKRALRHRLMLTDNEKPIVAFVGRLDPQKGLELVRHGIFYALRQGGQYVLLGSSPDSVINNEFWGAKRHLNDVPDCHLEIGYDEELAHLIYAGADMMLVPSRFEPCGLTQLIAMRYGTIPIVRSVGGLTDTVFDKDHSHRPLHERNGYAFHDYSNAGLESALGRAIACYYNYPEHFRELMKNAMRYDYSWNHPGRDYLNIYDYIRER